MLKFSILQQTLANLRFPDKDILRTGRLAPLAKTFDAYPVIEGSRRLCVLVPRGSDPASLKQLTEGQAQTKVVVLEQAGGAWAKIWPAATPEAPEPVKAEPAKVESAASADTEGEIEYVED